MDGTLVLVDSMLGLVDSTLGIVDSTLGLVDSFLGLKPRVWHQFVFHSFDGFRSQWLIE